jgi:hypothetical protein
MLVTQSELLSADAVAEKAKSDHLADGGSRLVGQLLSRTFAELTQRRREITATFSGQASGGDDGA